MKLKKGRWTSTERARAKELWEQGVDLGLIGKELNRDPVSVRGYMGYMGVKRGKSDIMAQIEGGKERSITQRESEVLYRFFNTYYKVRELAKSSGLDHKHETLLPKFFDVYHTLVSGGEPGSGGKVKR